MALLFPKLRSAAWLGVPAAALSLAALPAGVGAPVAAFAANVSAALLPIPGQPTVEPRLRAAAGSPCVVEIFNDVLAGGFGSYMPPSACPGPWAKVLLKLDVAGARNNTAANLRLEMDGVTVFWGAPQEHDGIASWHVERDLTDYAAWLHRPRDVFGVYDWDAASGALSDEPPALTGVARLVFYPATSVTPAQHVADAVLPVTSGPMTFPTNIERAYLDVYAQALNTDTDAGREWYSCVPTATATTYPAFLSPYAIGETTFGVFSINAQGCRGGSFREVQVRIDGQLAGIAPLFPWLPSDINRRFPDTVDHPAPSVQALNLVPYRVDLTPFAARLNDGLAHAVVIRGAGSDRPMPISTAGQLLLYRDHDRAHVNGALTLNTLATTAAPLTIDNTLVRSGEVLTGGLATRKDRSFVIRGYLDTSHGRIRSEVVQTSHFANAQQFRLDGLTYPAWRGYRQQIQLTSTTDRISRRRLGTRLLNEDREHVCYPLSLNYRGSGVIFEGDEGDRSALSSASLVVRQERSLVRSDYRPGMPRYWITLRDVFSGSHARAFPDFGPGVDSNWRSARSYLFKDTAGSCYSAALTTANGVLATSTLGAACSGGNVLRWFAHADGSPDSLGWAPMVP